MFGDFAANEILKVI